MVTCMPVNEQKSLTIFSVGTPMEEPKRVIVMHEGEDNGSGVWRCKSCGQSSRCTHIKMAQHELQRWVLKDPNARHELEEEDADDNLNPVRGKPKRSKA